MFIMKLSRYETYLPDERLDTTSTTVSLVKSDLTDDGAAVVPAIVSATDT